MEQMRIKVKNMNDEFDEFNFQPTVKQFGQGLNSKNESHLAASEAGKVGFTVDSPGSGGFGPPPIRAKPPGCLLQEEKPTHRIALELAAKGFTIKEIAEITGFTLPAVGNWLKQPNAVVTLANEVRRIHGEDEQVVQIIRENVIHAVNTLAGITKDPKAKGSDRIAAANALLERRYGKANQPINRNTDVDLNKLSDDDLVKMLPTESTGTT